MSKLGKRLIESAGQGITMVQLQNDLAAARTRFAASDEICNNLRHDHALQSKALHDALRERDDWRDAFKLIMRLVK
jgi:hypothetical protein